MDGQDLQHEELLVSEPVRLTFHRFDLVVGTLERASADGVVAVSQQACTVSRQRPGHLLQHPHPTGLRPPDPVVEERSSDAPAAAGIAPTSSRNAPTATVPCSSGGKATCSRAESRGTQSCSGWRYSR